ncbi:MFS general substrate transporter [Lentinus brumalis]|uniref:MFS general substrate transporter n=1 Tax=Lentinus brumalis TaxID=2498619 RepID=A0A371DR54_9APHY|nr:MFS general substrate transporter [Polyporus brumalis]
MILAYRYIRDKRRAAKAAHEAEGNASTAAHTSQTPLPDRDAESQTTHYEPPPPAAPSSSHSSSMKWKLMLMAALVVPVFFETLDYTVVATAQVHIASVFHRLDLQSYIGTVYLLTSTVFLPLFASLADVWGRHWALQVSLAFFLVGSAISTGSQNMPTMLVGRGIAGIGSAGMMAVVRIIMSDSRSLDDNNWQQTMLFLLFTIGYCVGPVIGGALTTVSFRWIFAINLPACAIAMVLSFLILRGRTKGAQPAHSSLPATSTPAKGSDHETFGQKLLRIDWVGAFLFMGAGITLLLALNWGSSAGWSSARVIACFVVSGVLYIAWVAWEYVLERKQESAKTSRNPLMRTDPMIPLQLFTSRDLCIAQYGMFVSGMVMIVMFYFVAIFFTIVGGLTGTAAGTQLLYFAPGLGAGSIISISLLKTLRQPKPPIVLGSIIITVALGMISHGMDINSKAYVDGFLVMAGVGVGMSIGPLAIHCRFSQPESRVAVVSALGLFSRALGGTVGLAQCGAVLNAKVNSIITSMITSGSLSAADASLLANGLTSGISSLQSIDSLPPDVQTAVKNAFQQGSRWSFISLVPWAGLSVFATLFLSNIRDTDKLEKERLRGAREEEAKREAGEKVQSETPVM